MSAESGKAQPVAGLRIVGWMTERERDESFPRLHKYEADAAYWVGVFTLPPRVTMRPVYAIDPDSPDPVRAALVEALIWYQQQCLAMDRTDWEGSKAKIALREDGGQRARAALRAAGVDNV